MADVGAPTKYDPKFCGLVVELGEKGASLAEMSYECGVCRNTLKNWRKEHSEFLTALTRAELASQVWWEKQGRDGMTADKFNSSVWSRSMAARFPDDWREVKAREHTGRDGAPIETADKTDPAVVERSLGRIDKLIDAISGSGAPATEETVSE